MSNKLLMLKNAALKLLYYILYTLYPSFCCFYKTVKFRAFFVVLQRHFFFATTFTTFLRHFKLQGTQSS